MLSRVTIVPSFRGTAARVTREKECHLVRMRMQPTFEPKEEKNLIFCIDVILPEGCVCFVSSYPPYPKPPPRISVECASIIGNGRPQMLSLHMKNNTDMTIKWKFDDPIAMLKFIDAFPVEVINAT